MRLTTPMNMIRVSSRADMTQAGGPFLLAEPEPAAEPATPPTHPICQGIPDR
jgi:hypothetical protein